MKLAALAVLALCFILLGASRDPVTSININNCGPLSGDVHLDIRVVSTGINYDQPSSKCELDSKTGTYGLTFFVPTPIPRGGEAAEYYKQSARH